MIRDEPIARFTCPGCGSVTVVYGDDELVPKDGQRCVRCLDPRQEAHDEFVRAERAMLEAV